MLVVVPHLHPTSSRLSGVGRPSCNITEKQSHVCSGVTGLFSVTFMLHKRTKQNPIYLTQMEGASPCHSFAYLARVDVAQMLKLR